MTDNQRYLKRALSQIVSPYTKENLEAAFRELGADDPVGWASSEWNEGIPQLARLACLRLAWSCVLDDRATDWIDPEIRTAKASPDSPYAGVGLALSKMRNAGVSDRDIADLVRGMQAQALFSFFCELDHCAGRETLPRRFEDIPIGLFMYDPDTQVPFPLAVNGLYEEWLGTDPTGREMRPSEQA